jgi:hypothetical protein
MVIFNSYVSLPEGTNPENICDILSQYPQILPQRKLSLACGPAVKAGDVRGPLSPTFTEVPKVGPATTSEKL